MKAADRMCAIRTRALSVIKRSSETFFRFSDDLLPNIIGSGSIPTLSLIRFLQGCYPMIKLHRLHQWHPTLPA